MAHQKYIPIQEYVNSTGKNEYKYFFKKDCELKGFDYENDVIDDDPDVEYGNDFLNCIIIDSKQI